MNLVSRQVNDEDEQSDREKLLVMKTEYERYKDIWGLNIRYSHSAGAVQNYSEFANLILSTTKKLSFLSCKKQCGAANGAHLLRYLNF